MKITLFFEDEDREQAERCLNGERYQTFVIFYAIS
jgi:hypothetical protein